MKLLDYIKKDSAKVGVWAVVLTEVAYVVLLSTALLVAGESLWQHFSWYAGAALPALLIVRFYAKEKVYLNATKGAIVALFVTFVAYMIVFIKYFYNA